MATPWMKTIAASLAGTTAVLGCVRPNARAEESFQLRTDSSQYTVVMGDGWYRAEIGYVFTNRSDESVSQTYCREPTPPQLEKDVNGTWTLAFATVQLACRSVTPFVVRPDHEYRGVLHMVVSPPGQNRAPELLVDSIPGVYRLRWVLRSGDNPDAVAARDVETVSNTFRLDLK